LPLSVCRRICLRILVGDLTECTVAGIGVRTIQLRAVKQVEVIELQNRLEAFAHVEVLPDIRIFVVEGRVAHLGVRSGCVTQNKLAGRGKAVSLPYLRCAALAFKLILHILIGSGRQLDRLVAIRPVAAIRGGTVCRSLRVRLLFPTRNQESSSTASHLAIDL